MSDSPRKDHITIALGWPDAWVCICGNTPDSDGFFPCDAKGNEVEPVEGWKELYVCANCGRIIHQSTRLKLWAKIHIRRCSPEFRPSRLLFSRTLSLDLAGDDIHRLVDLVQRPCDFNPGPLDQFSDRLQNKRNRLLFRRIAAGACCVLFCHDAHSVDPCQARNETPTFVESGKFVAGVVAPKTCELFHLSSVRLTPTSIRPEHSSGSKLPRLWLRNGRAIYSIPRVQIKPTPSRTPVSIFILVLSKRAIPG